jgi:hypothetical protein
LQQCPHQLAGRLEEGRPEQKLQLLRGQAVGLLGGKLTNQPVDFLVLRDDEVSFVFF